MRWLPPRLALLTSSDLGVSYDAIDVFSRRVVGRQLATSLHTELALDALEMRIWTRRRAGRDLSQLVHHSDRGVQYRAIRYTERLADAVAVASVGSKGDSYDCQSGRVGDRAL